MSKRNALLFLVASLLFFNRTAATNFWTPASQAGQVIPLIRTTNYLLFSADEKGLQNELFTIPANPSAATVMSLPMPNGLFRDFRVWQTPMLPGTLAARFPMIRTFTAELISDPTVTAKLDYTQYGFHAMIFDGDNTSFIDPVNNNSTGFYVVHYKHDEVFSGTPPLPCITIYHEQPTKDRPIDLNAPGANLRTVHGYELRSYRFALSCSHQYAIAATGLSLPTVAQVFSKMVTTINRINGVYEREVSVTLTFPANEYLLIDTTATGDPFGDIDDNAGACIATNQVLCDTKIGDANYDLGHVFTTGGGGLSQISVACQAGTKAQSVTGQANPVGDGFDIDYVAHELGHEFGADHPFNDNGHGSCANNGVEDYAYEPGSGSTLMAYAGICYPDDLTKHSDDYFHAINLEQIQFYLTHGGNGCGVKTPTGNKPVYLPGFARLYNIPFLTPFELTAPTAVDSVADTLTTYCWEQWDLGDFGIKFVDAHEYGPLFRSYQPKKSPTRVFPKDTMVLAWTLSDAGHENRQGEKAADVARFMTFRLTMRDIFQGKGCFLIPGDSIVLNVINTGTGFRVTSQGDSLGNYFGNSLHEVTWDVVGTNTGAVNTPNVDIYMSVDGGYNWPYHIGTFPNNGSALVPLPNPDTAAHKCRIKVKGTNNVFFNVNRYNFTVTPSDGSDTLIAIYPVPTHTTLRISSGNKGVQDFVIYEMGGKTMYRGRVDNIYDVAVNAWPRGIYIIKLIGPDGKVTIKKFAVN